MSARAAGRYRRRTADGVEEALLDEVRLAWARPAPRGRGTSGRNGPDEPVRVELTGARGRFEVVVTDAAAAGQDDCDQPSAQPAGWPGPGNGVPNGTSALDHSGAPHGLGLAVIAAWLTTSSSPARRPASASR